MLPFGLSHFFLFLPLPSVCLSAVTRVGLIFFLHSILQRSLVDPTTSNVSDGIFQAFLSFN